MKDRNRRRIFIILVFPIIPFMWIWERLCYSFEWLFWEMNIAANEWMDRLDERRKRRQRR